MRVAPLIVALICCLLCSCENEDNHPPEIISMIASPEMIFPNTGTTITVLATDADGDKLTYNFHADAGILALQDENVIMWGIITVESPGSYSVSCVVSDGEDTDCDSVSILVRLGL